MSHYQINIVARALLICLIAGASAAIGGCNNEGATTLEMPEPVDEKRVFVEELLPELNDGLRVQADAVATASEVQKYLEVEASHSWNTRVAGGIKYADLFVRLYPEHKYHKAFAQSDGLTQRGEVVLETLLDSDRQALDPAPYHVARIQQLVAELTRASAQDPAWKPVKLSGEEANQLVSWLHAHNLDTQDPQTREIVLNAIVGASVEDSVAAANLGSEKPDADAPKNPDTADILPSPIPRLSAELKGYLKVFQDSARLTAELELRVADGALRYARDMKHFNLVRLDWRDFRDAGGSVAIIYERLEKTFEALVEADADQSRALFAALQPSHPQYKKLLDARARYKAIEEAGGWSKARRTSLALGARSERVRALRQRLAVEGYLPIGSVDEPSEDTTHTNLHAVDSPTITAPAVDPQADPSVAPGGEASSQDTPRSAPKLSDPEVVDQKLIDAVKAYQKTHQFNVDGSPEAGFWRSINVSVARRIEQIELSIQRWRESQYEGEANFIMVNIPDFHAEVFVDHKKRMRFRVVTGNNKRVCDPETSKWTYPHATPIMMAKLHHVIINPYWYVPQGIITNELEPKIRRDPDYLEKNGYETVELNGREAIRQVPGPDNALGLVKFIFPNAGNIYMHDTPSKRYFDYPVRAFSHGCVRVNKPKELARFLLGNDPTAKKYDVDELIESGRQRYVELATEIPVFIEYKTVRVDDEGRTNFLADIYRRDRVRTFEDPEAREKYETCRQRRVKPVAPPPEGDDEHDTELPEGVESDVGP